MIKLLICGSRRCKYDYGFVGTYIMRNYSNAIKAGELRIIEGCCKDSADEHAERFAKEWNIPIIHYPVIKGVSPLKRNIDMVRACDEILSFYNNYSPGTSQTIANGLRVEKKITIITV